MFPAPNNNTIWPNIFESTFNQGWVLDSKTTELQPPLGLSMVSGSGSPWKLLSAELQYLLEPVRINTRIQIAETINSKTLLVYSDRTPAVIQGEQQAGSVILFGFNLDTQWGNLATKPIVVPLLQELVRTAVENEFKNNNVSLGTDSKSLTYEPTTTYIQQGLTRLSTVNSHNENEINRGLINSTGYWTARDNNGSVGKSFTVNIDPGTTNTSILTTDDILARLGDGWKEGSVRNTTNKEETPETLLIMLLALFFVLETVVSGRMGRNNRFEPQQTWGVD